VEASIRLLEYIAIAADTVLASGSSHGCEHDVFAAEQASLLAPYDPLPAWLHTCPGTNEFMIHDKRQPGHTIFKEVHCTFGYAECVQETALQRSS
jgi:hypothetical protein